MGDQNEFDHGQAGGKSQDQSRNAEFDGQPDAGGHCRDHPDQKGTRHDLDVPLFYTLSV